MKVSLSWLNELVRVDVPVDKLVDALNLSGTKVENVTGPAADAVGGVVVAEVLEIVPHPNADNLTLVEVKTGTEESQRVVCGARNFGVGDRVPLATVGARLPGMEITERKIRGEVSRGMLCSAMELGISKDHSGILVLPPDAELGDEVNVVLGLDDTVIELEITPNRPDCMSMLGIAREVGALLDQEVTKPDHSVAATTDGEERVSVDIRDGEGCPRYVARYLDGVSVGRSPGWMATRLLRAGIRPISNVVDVTNYVMLELGQPLHAFDADKIEDRKIVVRRAKSGEVFRTLDGVDRGMNADDLMIADRKKALAIAGVMGGEHSEIGPATTRVILESAFFDPVSVALTARRQLLRTESSARFERGADPELPAVAAARAVRLLAEVGSATPAGEVVDEYPVPVERRRITLRPKRTDSVLGRSVAPERQAALLRGIELEVAERGDELEVDIPGFRPDLVREIDLVEEVARLIGFQQLPSTLPPGKVGALEPVQQLDRAIRRNLVAAGVSEAWTGTFASERDLEALEVGAEPVMVANPISDEERALRTSMIPGLLRSAARNLAHHAPGVALFELSKIYERTDDRLPTEPAVLAGVFCGVRDAQSWMGPERRWDFFETKGLLDSTLAGLGLPAVEYVAVSGSAFHPTRAARLLVDEVPAGAIGELHPSACEHFDVPEKTVVFELALAPLNARIPGKVRIEDLPRFPAVYIDLAVVVDEGVGHAAVDRVIHEAGAPEVTSVRLFDVYRGDQVATGKKSLAYALELRDPERTLAEADTVAVRERVISALADRAGAEIRS